MNKYLRLLGEKEEFIGEIGTILLKNRCDKEVEAYFVRSTTKCK